jgi:hypothetical protein
MKVERSFQMEREENRCRQRMIAIKGGGCSGSAGGQGIDS